MKTPHSTLQGQGAKIRCHPLRALRFVVGLAKHIAQTAHERAHYDGLEQLHGT